MLIAITVDLTVSVPAGDVTDSTQYNDVIVGYRHTDSHINTYMMRHISSVFDGCY